jgi:hypothetical protein
MVTYYLVTLLAASTFRFLPPVQIMANVDRNGKVTLSSNNFDFIFLVFLLLNDVSSTGCTESNIKVVLNADYDDNISKDTGRQQLGCFLKDVRTPTNNLQDSLPAAEV